METRGRKRYLEGISHITRTRPYHVYQSHFSADGDALYLHWHPEAELFFLEDGALDFWVEDTCYPLREGEAVLVTPGLLHRAAAVEKKNGSFYALVFSLDLIAVPGDQNAFEKYAEPVLRSPESFCVHLKPDAVWQREVLGDLRRIFAQQKAGWDSQLVTVGLIQAIWQNLYNYDIRQVKQKYPAGTQGEQIRKTVSYLQEHYQEEVTLKQLAENAHVSEGQLCRLFRQMTGSAPFTYLKRYRIRKSCTYLAETDKKIAEICTLCGFNNISYFNREFLKMVRLTPSAYRAQAQGMSWREEAFL